jgi:hypothetical protein
MAAPGDFVETLERLYARLRDEPPPPRTFGADALRLLERWRMTGPAGVPDYLHQALTRLVDQVPQGLEPIPLDHVGTYGLLEDLARLVPRTRARIDAEHERVCEFAAPALGLSIFVTWTLDDYEERCSVAAATPFPRASESPEVHLPAPLCEALGACEVHCVAGCCGLDAFEFESRHVRDWLKTQPAGTVDRVQAQLTALADDTFELSEVVSHQLNVRADRALWSSLLARFRELFARAAR